MAAGRTLGSLARAARRSRSRDAGTSVRPVEGAGTSRMRFISAYVELSPPGCSKGERPRRGCQSVAASEYTSERTVAGPEAYRVSTGDHGTETPASSSAASLMWEAMPKSVSPGVPYWLVRMFAGLMSRWSRPARCAVSTAELIWMPMRSTSATLNRSRLARSASEACG